MRQNAQILIPCFAACRPNKIRKNALSSSEKKTRWRRLPLCTR